MKYKIISVFFDENGNPFKDVAREVPCSIINGAFIGASNTTKVYFYYDKLLNEDDDPATWVAVSKLPNGKIGSKVLESYLDEEINEHYALLELDSFYTKYKGDVYLALQGYQGGVQVLEDSETGIYTIVGTPTIQTTGNVRLNILYAPQFIGSDETENVNFQQILADLSTKLGIRAQTVLVNELPSIGETNVFYVIKNDSENPNKANIYVWNGTTQIYVWVGDNTLFLGDYYTKEQGQEFESDLNEQLDEFKQQVEDELESVGSGSPAGVYSTLQDLENDTSADKTRIYIVGTNWYYWNGSAWTSGGEYLSSLPDGELNADSTNAIQNKTVASLFDVDYGINLLDYTKSIVGFIQANGTYSDGDSYRVTDYIPVSQGQVITWQTLTKANANMRFVCAYDNNKQPVAESGSNSNIDNYTVPSGIKWVRISVAVADFTSDCMVKIGVLPVNKEPYHAPYYYLKPYNLDKELQETKKLLDCFELKYGTNLFDKNNYRDGWFINASGLITDNEEYFYTNLIPVKSAQKITAWNDGTQLRFRCVCAMNKDKQIIAESGSNSYVDYYIVPDGIAYIILTIQHQTSVNKVMVVVGDEYPGYEAYKEPYYALTDSVVVQQNYFDKNAPDVVMNAYCSYGEISENDSYFVTGFIEVEPNTTYSLCDGVSYRARIVQCYDSDKNYIVNTNEVNVEKITTTATTKYIRCTFWITELDTASVVKGDKMKLGMKYAKLIPGHLVTGNDEVPMFLPKEIICAIGTTIEIYNDQVMPCASHYHFKWKCDVGKPLNRKFSITGTSQNKGTYNLRLEIYDDALESIAVLTSQLKIVEPISTNKSICPIGDSLSNNKYWLKYVNDDLSNGKITYVGTLNTSYSGLKDEGRSGATTEFYLSDEVYEGVVNPFWDSVEQSFSWSYYKSSTGVNPDAVQIWLGTNDIIDKSIGKKTFVQNMLTMISKIRNADAILPIFVCLTILPAEQNGIGVQTSVDGFAANNNRYQYKWWCDVINGVKMLESAILSLNDSNIHIIPLVCSHDSKYNFGIVETPVNPHTPSIAEPMPIEGVHPQQNGYEQIGDILYSCYCAKLGS